MRGCYMGEYQSNFDQNTSRKDDKIADMKAAIRAKEDYISELESQEHMTLEFMQRQIYAKKIKHFKLKKVWDRLKYNQECFRRNKMLGRRAIMNLKANGRVILVEKTQEDKDG